MPSKVCNDIPFFKDVTANGLYTGKTTALTGLQERWDYPGPLPYIILCDELPDSSDLHIFISESTSSNIIVVVRKIPPARKQQCWELLGASITDILQWTTPEDLVEYIVSKADREKHVDDIINSSLVKKNLAGEGRVWKAFLAELVEVALFSESSILLIGESGTGKEILSRLVHTIDRRPAKKDIVLVDCTTITQELSGSEFFGHERGSYTNAHQSREGAFALANNGTLFLDEVGELPMQLQSELLRVIQEGSYKKVGSNTWQKTKFRLICATNKNLQALVNEGKFRQDLYFRISDFEFRVPTLEERLEDIPKLAEYFLAGFYPNGNCPEFDESVMDYLVRRHYPGNIRELKQLVSRIVLKHVRHKKITMGEIPLQDRLGNTLATRNTNGNGEMFDASVRLALLSGLTLQELKNKTKDEAIRIALELSGDNNNVAAQKLGVDIRTIQQFRKERM